MKITLLGVYWIIINSNWFEYTKKLDADSKAIQQIEFVEQLKRLDNDDDDDATYKVGNDQYMFVWTILENIKETRNKCNSIIKDGKLATSES